MTAHRALSGMTGVVVRTAAITIERLEVPAGFRLRGHRHDVPHLCFLAMGAYAERDARRVASVGAGTLRRSPAGDEHDLRFAAPSRCVLILVHGNPGEIQSRLPPERRFLSSRRIQTLATALSRSLEAPHDASALHIDALVLELLAASMPPLGRRSPLPPAWLEHIRDRIRDAPASPPSTAVLAGDAGYHPVYVARAFREYFGIGVGEYARMAQAEYARRLLARSDEPLAQVAATAGYADKSHLTRAMRRLLGATPAAVRRRTGCALHVASVQDAPRASG
ncbi:MAG TPA: AraC family transcriptional regulator [Gemmatimonadaceae bacterium]|nr:AraC family transcriptional regulator [Gemmatimonadaceae bacterium]